MSQIDCIKHDCQNGRHNSCDGCNVYELHKVIFQSGNYCNADVEDLIALLKDKKKTLSYQRIVGGML
jgi:hypothetical protein